jgi:ABC-type cobalt transport system substrate-binding protein
MSLRLNPSYRGWMTPIFENEEIRTLPFGVAIIGGVVYRLGK